MRENMGLYHGKCVDNGKWVEGYYCVSHGRLNGCNFDYHSIYNYENKEHYKVDPETVGQYTGLTDKNGKKIFEGDIVKLDVYENLKPIISVVGWEAKYAVFVLNGKGYHTDFYHHWGEETEVIGNIHDNRELLKGGAE